MVNNIHIPKCYPKRQNRWGVKRLSMFSSCAMSVVETRESIKLIPNFLAPMFSFKFQDYTAFHFLLTNVAEAVYSLPPSPPPPSAHYLCQYFGKLIFQQSNGKLLI